jgi:hypothetical protein
LTRKAPSDTSSIKAYPQSLEDPVSEVEACDDGWSEEENRDHSCCHWGQGYDRESHPRTRANTHAAGLHVSNIRRYEAGTNQPNIDALRNLALALGTSTDKLLFEPNERGPQNDLLLAFEAASTRLDQEGQNHLKATLEGLLRAETRRWAS